MAVRIFLPFAIANGAALMASRGAVGQTITVSQAVQVSRANASLSHSEVILAADPADKRHLLACSMVEPAAPSIQLDRNVAYVSFDSGESWSEAFEFGGDLTSSDPSCIVTGELAYYAGLVFDFAEGQLRGKTVLYASLDGGRTWTRASTLGRGDREFLMFDGAERELLLLETVASESLRGGTSEPLVLYASNDGGRSFGVRAVISTEGNGAFFGYPGGILPDGTIATAFANLSKAATDATLRDGGITPPGELGVLLYVDSTSSPGTVKVVNDLYGCNAWRNSAPMPSLAVDSSQGTFGGRMYIAWPDSRSGACRILFSRSGDQGKSWSAPVGVDNDPQQAGTDLAGDSFHPVVAVNRDGVVGILWCDREDSSDALSWRPRFTASLDGGLTFLPSVALPSPGMRFLDGDRVKLDAKSEGGGSPAFHSGGAIHTSFGYWGHALTGGETIGLAADAAGVFHALWVDNRTGITQIWTARMVVGEAVRRNGSAQLARLEDVSSRVAVLFSDIHYDRREESITASAYIENTSNSAIYSPLELRVLRVNSKIGSAQLQNADNHGSGSGAIFDFDCVLPGGVLRPKQKTGGKRIAIRLERVRPRVSKGDYDTLFQFVTLDSVVLASTQ